LNGDDIEPEPADVPRAGGRAGETVHGPARIPCVRRALALSLSVALVACGAALAAAHRGSPPAPLPASRVPVVLELFSSEGCNSCPRADAYLSTLDRLQPVDGVTVIALEEHVDYWDGLGWRDPFASPAFGERQSAYARVLADHGVFTPELVLDGREVLPGDDAAAAAAMQRDAREPRAHVAVRRDGGRVVVDVTDVPPPGDSADDAAEVLLAVTESGLESDVAAGENEGRRLKHAPVVRALRVLGRVASGAFHADVPLDAVFAWKPRALRVVAFVQRARSHRIVGAGAA
jgi:hypothetical protein